MRLLRSNLTSQEVAPRVEDLVGVLYNEVPAGVGGKGIIRLSRKELEDGPLINGARWAVSAGYGQESDLAHTESGGRLEGAEPRIISDRASERGAPQLGTLGSGNHFIEIQYVDEIYDEEAAAAFGLFKGQATVMLHTGSRGLGHQVCTDFLGTMSRASGRYGFDLPDRELACAPLRSPEAREYLAAMRAAANYAWANRQVITQRVRDAFMRALRASPRDLGMSMVYDVAHNIAKLEEHMVDGDVRKLMVHRKGATRAFPPGHSELSERYRNTGQPVIIPGDMGRASYVLKGAERSMQETWGSTCHGAGRMLSRHQAMKQARGRAIWRELKDRGVVVMAKGRRTMAEEMPEAYKDVSEVVEVVHRAGISTRVARLRPMGVIKG